jgi:rare lipoprotein A
VFARPIHAGAAPFLGATICAAITLSACSHKIRTPVPAPAKTGATETGIASWYGEPYNGRRAASGEIYDMEQFTAAHRTLPFNTWVDVADLDNGKHVEVRIIDRGPFVDGRIIDLSLAAARSLEMLGPGTARVRLKVISAPVRAPDPKPAPVSSQPDGSKPVGSKPPADLWAVQAGAFSDPGRAGAFAASLREQYKDTVVIESTIRGSTVWRVLIARELALEDANRLAAKVRAASGEALVVPNL